MTTTTNVSGADSASVTQGYDRFDAQIQLRAGDTTSADLDTLVEMISIQRSQMLRLRAQDSLAENKAQLALMDKSREMLAQMKDLKQQAKQNGLSTMPPDMKKFCDDNGIKTDRTANDDIHSSDQWDVNIEYLNSFVDKISGQSKTQFLQLQRLTTDSDDSLREASTMVAKHHDLFQAMVQSFGR